MYLKNESYSNIKLKKHNCCDNSGNEKNYHNKKIILYKNAHVI